MSPEQRSAGLRQADIGWYCSEWELTGGDVEEALAWADEHVVGWEVAEVWVVVPGDEDGRGNGMVRIRDYNPNQAPAPTDTGRIADEPPVAQPDK